jgi:hypothetical protein
MPYQKQWELLKKTAELGKLPHAYLFYGQDRDGIRALAFNFVQLINGEDSLKNVHPDLHIVEPEENEEIEIIQIRDLRAKLSLRSYSAFFKTAIIDQADRLNQEAQSAFLKLLEEPSGQTLFILITAYPETILPTILSRVERMRFYSRRKEEDFDPAHIKKIGEISRLDLAGRFQRAKELSEDTADLKKMLEAWLWHFRSALLSGTDSDRPKIIQILKTMQTVHYLISTTNVNPRLALEIIMLEL